MYSQGSKRIVIVFFFVIMWRAHKPCAIHGSKTLDQLTTNYLFIGWRPKISWSFLFSRYWLQLAV